MKEQLTFLADALFAGNTYDKEGNCNYPYLDSLIQELSKSIDEHLKRSHAAKKIAYEIIDVLEKYGDESFVRGQVTITDKDLTTIRDAANDIRRVLNEKDEAPVEDNWFNLFPKLTEEKLQAMANYLNHKGVNAFVDHGSVWVDLTEDITLSLSDACIDYTLKTNKMELTLELAKEMLSSGNETLKAAAIKAFPELHKSNFELACEALGIPPTIPEGLSVSMRAQYQLEKIIQVANEGWTPNFEDTDEWKYYPVFDVVTKALDDVFDCGSDSVIPAPILFKSEELCEEVVNDNLELYRQMFFGVCS